MKEPQSKRLLGMLGIAMHKKGNIESAIKKTIELLDRKDFENYNIIDLRIDGKIIVE